MITECTVQKFETNQKSKQFLNYETEITAISAHNLRSTQNAATQNAATQNNAHNLKNKKTLTF